MSLTVYPGSFDFLTLGHVDVAVHVTTLFDVVVIGTTHDAAKVRHCLLDAHERLHLAREATSHLPSIEVDIVPGLLADYYTQRGANVVIKGLRSGSDLDAELPMALLNRDPGAPETVFLPASVAYAHTSSSLVKDVVGYGRDVSALVLPAVAYALTVWLAQTPGLQPTTAPTLDSSRSGPHRVASSAPTTLERTYRDDQPRRRRRSAAHPR